ncbi:MAG: hypothetical protein K8H88_16550 [Sandaracinaceae bacterium]|nr:hypothetical protein [Sandaracinaceae bacterium]
MAAAIVLAACSVPEGRFTCRSDLECPGGQFCHADQRCRSTPGPRFDGGPDAGFDAGLVDAGSDASTDAPSTDAP